MSTTSGASTGILDLSEDLHLYLCQSLYPRHINNLARTCKQLHHRLNPELWKLGTATPDGKDEILYHAALTGDLALLQKLTDEYKLDFDRLNMQRAIRNAAKGSHESVITYLLSTFGKYGDAADLDLSESLNLAAKNGNTRIAQLLLDHGVSVRDKAGTLRTAADNTHAEVVDVLLNKQDPDIAEIISASDSSVVTCALDLRTLQLTGSELSAGAIPAKVEPTIAILLNHGFDLESNTEFGLTPLMCAVYKGHPWAVEMLLSHGASTTVKCPRGSTVLHYAVGLPGKEQRIEIEQLLLQYEADITCKNENGTTPLSLAAECQRLDYLRLMVPSLSTLSTLDEHREKFLCLAARKGDVDWASALIRLGADVNKIQSIERHISAHRSGIDVLAEKAKLAQRKSTDQDPEDKT
ncbi:hypothetical protein ASPVEDRAFT_84206 [Aspergillus versicolor CBS 583.65]|uniref:Uncharacterized protein n=1 Tax=Aspergillus versicolor CBS 583.65 TaxID=1036611 RepID=A0A1L9PMF9_ASPVE|nr:uncharacterized protein ASPVEDRAFT_84206 [Aspergillus versicolor CBS 583.65]OJJ02724.1 hypothetical protein ASPVEDRAFT_84206 [Aspergillus versicolor CBS 583.65]